MVARRPAQSLPRVLARAAAIQERARPVELVSPGVGPVLPAVGPESPGVGLVLPVEERPP